jgi:outer membrane protein OmpA-like peptidoglycan-associated protein
LHIVGHTDNVGDDAFNLGLSQNRAHEVVAFLVSCGIDASRLHAEGYGETRPKASNATDEGRRLNRRTEFRWQNRP